jgi:hypothetical protein
MRWSGWKNENASTHVDNKWVAIGIKPKSQQTI